MFKRLILLKLFKLFLYEIIQGGTVAQWLTWFNKQPVEPFWVKFACFPPLYTWATLGAPVSSHCLEAHVRLINESKLKCGI